MSREKGDIVSQASANLLFKQLQVTREEVLRKYPNYIGQKSSEQNIPHNATSVSANQKFKPLVKIEQENHTIVAQKSLVKPFSTNQVPYSFKTKMNGAGPN